jgi:hypothetical protein
MPEKTTRLKLLCLLFTLGLGDTGLTAPARQDELQEAITWLDEKAHEMIRASVRTTQSGIRAFPPQVGTGYEAFWLRDYEYMLEGRVASFSDKELKDACRFFVNAQRGDGAMVDCVMFTGKAIYMPGYGSMGQNPVADGSQFAVGVAYHTYRKTKDKELLKAVVDPLIRGMNAAPRNPKTALVVIDPNLPWDRCPYGFTDTIRKKGEVLFCSLLYVQASRQLGELLDVLGRATEAQAWQQEADHVAKSVRDTFWDQELGLFRAATLACREPDIWGSAFAVYTGVANNAQARTIAAYFRDHYHEIVKRGQLRHTPGGVYWEKALAKKETYQNGAYWGTPIGWFVYTLDLVSPELADQTIIDLVADFRKHGVFECINDNGYAKVPRYVASAALPLDGIRAMLARRKQ